MMKKVIIIGGGMAGLSAAAYLSRRGVKVSVFERLPQVGGYTNSFKRSKYWFESSTHQLLGLNTKGYADEIFRTLGIDHLILEKSDILNEFILFHQNRIKKRYLFPAGMGKIKQKLMADFPHQRKNILRILKLERKITEQSLKLVSLSKTLNILPVLVDAVFALMLKDGKGLLQKLGRLRYYQLIRNIDKSFDEMITLASDDTLRWLLTQYWIYVGVPPLRASSVILAIISYIFYSDGPYMIRGGLKTLVDSMKNVIEGNGGVIHPSSEVTRIIVEQGRAVGLKTKDNRVYHGDIFISSINPSDTFIKMIGEKKLPRDYTDSIRSLNFSKSAFQVYLGLPFDIRDYGFPSLTSFFSSSLDANINYRRSLNGVTADTPFIMTNYTNFERPNGHSSLIILEYDNYSRWKHLNKKQYRLLKLETQKKIIEKTAGITGIPLEKAELVFSATPGTFRHHSASPEGCILASELSVDQSLNKRMASETPIENLYLTGSYVTGPGITTCLNGGITTANTIIRAGRI
jgi:phytoene dehydrogenase-like protein